MRRGFVFVGGACGILLAGSWLWTRVQRGGGEAGGRTPGQERSVGMAGADVAEPAGSGVSQPGRVVAHEPLEVAETQPKDDALDAIERILEELRQLAAENGYHAQAWPLVRRLATLVGGAAGGGKRVEDVARSADEVSRVRAACLLALALARGEGVCQLLNAALLEGDPELRRTVWLGWVLSSGAGPGLELPLDEFESPTGLRTWPLVLKRRLQPARRLQALSELESALESDRIEIGARGRDETREEQFSREIILISGLGTAAGADGPERERLLAMVESGSAENEFVRAAAAFCLARAARWDEALAERLFSLALSADSADQRARFLIELAHGGNARRVLDGLRFVLSQPAGEQDDLARVRLLELLSELIASDDESLSRGAVALTAERISDPDLDGFERLLYLERLSAGSSAAFLDVAEELLSGTPEPETLADLASVMGWLQGDDASQGQDLLSKTYDPGIGIETRRAIVQAAIALDAPGTPEFLELVLTVDPSEELRALAQEALNKGS